MTSSLSGMARRRHLTLFDFGAAALDTGVTLWFRWPILMAACASHAKPQDAAEIRRMVSEKMLAAAQGAVQSQLELSRLALGGVTGKLSSKDIGALLPRLRARLSGRRCGLLRRTLGVCGKDAKNSSSGFLFRSAFGFLWFCGCG